VVYSLTVNVKMLSLPTVDMNVVNLLTIQMKMVY